MTDEDSGWERIGRVAKARREQLKLNQDELSPYGGPRVATVGKFERGAQDNFPPRTQAQFEKALNWPAGTIADYVRRVDAGEEIDHREDWELVYENIPTNRVLVDYYRSVAEESDVVGTGEETVAMKALLMLLRMVPEDFRQEAVERAADAIMAVKAAVEADELAERRRGAIQNLSDPGTTTDPALVADDQDEWAGEQESHNEP